MALLVLLVILFVFLASLILSFRFKIARLRKETARKAADNIFNSLRESYGETHERVPVSPDDFPDLDHRFYDDAQRAFEALGYRFLADIEDRTLTEKNPQRRTMIRILTSADRMSHAAISVAATSEKVPSIAATEICSEFQDHTFIISTTAPNSGMSFPPEMIIDNYPPDSSAEALAELHRNKAAEYQSAHSATAIRIETVDDLLASMARQTRLKHLFRKSLGYGWTESEKQFFTEGRDPALMGSLVKELDKLAAKAISSKV